MSYQAITFPLHKEKKTQTEPPTVIQPRQTRDNNVELKNKKKVYKKIRML